MRADNVTTKISSVLVGELGTGEQLFLWALRQRLADRGETTPSLVRGFLLACGLAGVETALGSFERLFDLLRARAGQGMILLEKCGWDGLSERVMAASYSASRSFRTAAI